MLSNCNPSKTISVCTTKHGDYYFLMWTVITGTYICMSDQMTDKRPQLCLTHQATASGKAVASKSNDYWWRVCIYCNIGLYFCPIFILGLDAFYHCHQKAGKKCVLMYSAMATAYCLPVTHWAPKSMTVSPAALIIRFIQMWWRMRCLRSASTRNNLVTSVLWW